MGERGDRETGREAGQRESRGEGVGRGEQGRAGVRMGEVMGRRREEVGYPQSVEGQRTLFFSIQVLDNSTRSMMSLQAFDSLRSNPSCAATDDRDAVRSDKLPSNHQSS